MITCMAMFFISEFEPAAKIFLTIFMKILSFAMMNVLIAIFPINNMIIAKLAMLLA